MLVLSRCINPPVPVVVTWIAVLISVVFAGLLALKNYVFFEFRKISFSWVITCLVLLIGMVFIFFLRENYGIDDIFMPTDLVGMTERVRQGLVPVSFSSFPDFYANYHQAFVVFTGMIAQLTSMSALQSILFTFPFLLCLILVNLYLVVSTATRSMWHVLLLIGLFLTTSSFVSIWPWAIVMGSGAYQSLMFLDVFFSNTLVLGTLDVLM